MCNNWRGITLISVTSKVFSKVILDRISAAIDPLTAKEQAGFRKGRSCGGHIFTMQQIMEQCQEWNTLFSKRLSTTFTDSLVYSPALRNPPRL